MRILPSAAVTVMPWPGWASRLPVAGVMLRLGRAGRRRARGSRGPPPAVPGDDWLATASWPTEQAAATSGAERCRGGSPVAALSSALSSRLVVPVVRTPGSCPHVRAADPPGTRQSAAPAYVLVPGPPSLTARMAARPPGCHRSGPSRSSRRRPGRSPPRHPTERAWGCRPRVARPDDTG